MSLIWNGNALAATRLELSQIELYNHKLPVFIAIPLGCVLALHGFAGC